MSHASTLPQTHQDWPSLRATLNLASIASELLGPSPGRRSDRSPKRLWWHCPFHRESNPSFSIDVGSDRYKCFGCGESGDAASLVMHVQRLTFPQAVAFLADRSRNVVARPAARSRPREPCPANRPRDDGSMLRREDAESIVETASAKLLRHPDFLAYAYLRNRGLEHKTIAEFKLGLVDLPSLKGRPKGITIPWFDRAGKIVRINLRQPPGRTPKYREIFRDSDARTFFPSPSAIEPSKPAVFVEGEFDAILLTQELSCWGVSFVTLGSASFRFDSNAILPLLSAPRIAVAFDADEAGETAAGKVLAKLGARSFRFRPPAGSNDWTDLFQRDRLAFHAHFGSILHPSPSSE